MKNHLISLLLNISALCLASVTWLQGKKDIPAPPETCPISTLHELILAKQPFTLDHIFKAEREAFRRFKTRNFYVATARHLITIHRVHPLMNAIQFMSGKDQPCLTHSSLPWFEGTPKAKSLFKSGV